MSDTSRPDLLLWVDLETTGSDPEKDCIIEIGAILTTEDLSELGTFSVCVQPTPEGYGRLMLNPVVHQMHTVNGLLAEMAELAGEPHGWPKPDMAAKRLLAWLTNHNAPPGRTVLAGSGVGHFDRAFIRRWMPQVDRFLRYWCIDIGVIRRAHGMWVGTEVSTANEGKTHRALDDITCHLAEARAFKAAWQQNGGHT